MTKFQLVARIEDVIGPTVGLWRASKPTLERLADVVLNVEIAADILNLHDGDDDIDIAQGYLSDAMVVGEAGGGNQY